MTKRIHEVAHGVAAHVILRPDGALAATVRSLTSRSNVVRVEIIDDAGGLQQGVGDSLNAALHGLHVDGMYFDEGTGLSPIKLLGYRIIKAL